MRTCTAEPASVPSSNGASAPTLNSPNRRPPSSRHPRRRSVPPWTRSSTVPSTTAGRTVDCACCSSAAVALFAVAATAGGFVAAARTRPREQREAAQIEALTSTALSLRGDRPGRRGPARRGGPPAMARRPSHALRAHGRDDEFPRPPRDDASRGRRGHVRRAHPGNAARGRRDRDRVAVYDIDSGALVYPVDLPRDGRNFDLDSRFGPAVSGNGARVANAERIVDDDRYAGGDSAVRRRPGDRGPDPADRSSSTSRSAPSR